MTAYMASSIRAVGSVRYIEMVRFSEGPLSEVTLYILMKALKRKALGAELANAYILYSLISAFYDLLTLNARR